MINGKAMVSIKKSMILLVLAMIITCIAVFSVAFNPAVADIAEAVNVSAPVHQIAHLDADPRDAANNVTDLKFSQGDINDKEKEGDKYVSGDFYSDAEFADISVSADGKAVSLGSLPSVPSAPYYCDLAITDDFKYALEDPFINVNVNIYIKWSSPQFPDKSDNITVEFAYYNNYPTDDMPFVVSNTVTAMGSSDDGPANINFTIDSRSWGVNAFARITLKNWQRGGDGGRFSVAWEYIRVTVNAEAATKNKPSITEGKEAEYDMRPKIAVYDPTSMRLLDISKKQVKPGDIVVVRLSLVGGDGATEIFLPSDPNNPEKPDPNNPDEEAEHDKVAVHDHYAGYYYMKKYFWSTGTNKISISQSNPFVKCESGQFFQKLSSYNFPDTFPMNNFDYVWRTDENGKKLYYDYETDDGGNVVEKITTNMTSTPVKDPHKRIIPNDYTGLITIFRVVSAQNENGATPEIKYSIKPNNMNENEAAGCLISFKLDFMLDENDPGVPELDTTPSSDPSKPTFYQKYCAVSSEDSCEYYVEESSYIRKSLTDNTVIGLDLSKGVSIPRFRSQAFTLSENDSDLYIYCKATRVKEIPYSGVSNGFKRSEGQLYCKVFADTKKVEYYSLILDLAENPDEPESQRKYSEEAFYSLEFLAIDAVGNEKSWSTKVFMKVDVSDYEFDCSLVLGRNTLTDKNKIDFNIVRVRFASILDNGKLSSFDKEYTVDSKVAFKRGQKIVARVTVNNTAYRMTSFVIGAGNTTQINTTYNSYDGYTTQVPDAKTSQPGSYAFAIDSTFTSNPSKRVIQIYFKYLVDISVSNTNPIYTGDPQKLITVVTCGGAQVNCAVDVYYTKKGSSWDIPDSDYTTDVPVEAGDYYFRCEISGDPAYFGVYPKSPNNTFVVRKATPVLRSSAINIRSINYGESLELVDFEERPENLIQNFNTAIGYVDGFTKIYNRSIDGVYGYYELYFEDKNSVEYTKPNAGTMTVNVRFVPVQHKGGIPTKRYIDGITRFLPDENYEAVICKATVKVEHSKDVNVEIIDFDQAKDAVVYDYDGEYKSLKVAVTSNIEFSSGQGLNLEDFIEITYRKEEEKDYRKDHPRDAGIYYARIALVDSKNDVCNYILFDGRNNYIEKTVIINKQKVQVITNNTSVDYQYEKAPEPIAVGVSGKLSYNFIFYNFESSIEESVKEENIVESSNIFRMTQTPINAGKYVVQSILNERNYENANESYALFTVKMVTADNYPKVDTAQKYIRAPALRADNLGYHIYYMQKLNVVKFGDNGKVMYEFHNDQFRYYSQEITGKFIVAYRLYNDGEDIDEFCMQNSAYQLTDVVLESNSTLRRQQVYIYFIPSPTFAANFAPVIASTEYLKVGKAKFNYDDIKIDDVVYGTELKTAADLKIQGNAKIKTGEIVEDGKTEDEYMEIPSGDADYGYEISFNRVPGSLGAGESSISMKVTVTGAKRDFIVADNFSYYITIEKMPLELSFADYDKNNGCYVYPYGSVQEPAVTNSLGISVRTERKYYSVKTEYGQEVLEEIQDKELLVASDKKYVVIVSVRENNYCGEAGYEIKIKKADLTLKETPKIYDQSEEVSYGKPLGAVKFYSGEVEAEYNGEKRPVRGWFYFICEQDELFKNTGEEQIFPLGFTPDDTNNYNELVYSEQTNKNCYLKLKVEQNDISYDIDLTVNMPDGGFKYGDIKSAGFSPTDIVSYDTYIYKAVSGAEDYTIGAGDGYVKLGGSFICSSALTSGAGNVPAGTYEITFKIDDKNYKGEKKVTFEIKKRQAEIIVEEEDKIVDFNNMSQSIKFVVKSGENTISERVVQTFRDYSGVSLAGAPYNVGKYEVTLALSSNNYEAQSVKTDFTIRVAESYISVNNITQVYSVPRQVSVSIRLIDARCSNIYYVEKVGDAPPAMEAKSKVLPTNAGEYWVILEFGAVDNRGYEETIVYERPLVIEKYQATIESGGIINTVYTGKKNQIRISTKPASLNCDFEYCRAGENSFGSTEILEANVGDETHFIRVTINEKNYVGSAIIPYRISPASLSILEMPTFGEYYYNSDTAPEASGGKMYFGTDTIEGAFSIDVNDIKTLSVGVQNVKFAFTAYKDKENNIVDTNFRPYGGTIAITVAKREIPEEMIIIGEKSGDFAEYNGKYFTVDAHIVEGIIFDPITNADLTIKMLYNGQTGLPKEPGEYVVRAEISSANYTGARTWDRRLVIDKGTPVIVDLPTAANGLVFKIGDTFVTSSLQDGSGLAVIKGLQTRINGDFVAETKRFERANKNIVTGMFIPNDRAHFYSVPFAIEVNVYSDKNPLSKVTDYGDWNGTIGISFDERLTGDVTVKAGYYGKAYYGVAAGDFYLIVDGAKEVLDSLDEYGKFEITDVDYIPEVGGQIGITFVPMGDYSNDYNIMYGYISVNIEKAELPSPTVEFVVFENQPFASGECIVRSDGKIIIIEDGEIKLYDGDTPVVMSATADANTYRYVFSSKNYADIEGLIEVIARKQIRTEDIIVDKLTKSYDGHKISYADVEVKVVNTAMILDGETDVTVTAYKNGRETDECIPGEYSVIIRIDNGRFYGEKAITYTIERGDLSSMMELDTYTATYGRIVAPKVKVDGELWTESCVLSYKQQGVSDALYNSVLPDRAGVYNVKAVIDGEIGLGEAVFTFRISARLLTVNTEINHTYDYGKAEKPAVYFTETDSITPVQISYGIYYYSDVYSIGEINVLPSNAGVYTARVVSLDPDYSLGAAGYYEFRYEIKRRSVTISVLPEIYKYFSPDGYYNLRYGQKLGELTLSGGEAKHGDTVVPGKFRVENPDLKPDVPLEGGYSVNLCFEPDDNNYATVIVSTDIAVAKADASVIFETLQVSYTGTAVWSNTYYSVSPANVSVIVSFTDTDNRVLSPNDLINAGGYRINIVSGSRNYKVSTVLGKDSNGEYVESPTFVISQASVREVYDPIANPVLVGESLEKSSLNSGDNYGKVFYYGFTNPVEGRFAFLEEFLPFSIASPEIGYEVKYVFTPNDANFATYLGTVNVKVNKGMAFIQSYDMHFTYSEEVYDPSKNFITSPGNLKVESDVGDQFLANKSNSVGVYYFHAWISDEEQNYTSEKIQFAIYIDKKQIDMDFVMIGSNGKESVVTQYRTTYGNLLDARIRLYPDGTLVGETVKVGYLEKDGIVNGERIGDTYDVLYESAENGITYSAHIPPTDIGVYKATVSLIHANYSAKAEALYKVELGKIDIKEQVAFDKETLDNQVYGSVVAPIITTTPANIKYYIVYQGNTEELPKDAGNYNITIYFNDPNYEKVQCPATFRINKKKIKVTNIVVSDKVYDGLSTLDISGQLSGVNYGDEVDLRMTATTVNNDPSVGSHYVDITSYTLVGLQASNYDLEPPVYYNRIYIAGNKVTTSNSISYITSTSGFDNGTSVEFVTVNSPQNQAKFFDKVTGRDSVVMGYTIQVNGADSIIKDTFKVYMAIPEEYINTDFEVKGVGSLEGQNIVFTREGDYITFYASSSGQIQFKKTEFRYEFVVIVVAIGIALIGIVILLILNPLQHRKKVGDNTSEKEAIQRIKKGY